RRGDLVRLQALGRVAVGQRRRRSGGLEAGRSEELNATVAAGAGAPRRQRLVALDVFRGLTVAGMLLVNDPGTWGAIYPPLEHATWNGWTPTDVIFPFFLFIAGVTTHLSMTARRARGATDRD